MSAYRGSMCLLRKCHKISATNACFRLFSDSAFSLNRPSLLKRVVIQGQSSIVCFYSNVKDKPNVKGLTDEILKSKIRDEVDKNKENNQVNEIKNTEQDGKRSSKWSKYTGKNAWKLGITFLGGYIILMSGFVYYTWGAPARDPEGNVIEDEFSDLPTAQAYLKRALKELSIFKRAIQDPSREKLLPDPVSYPYYQPPYTLVIEMKGILVHPDWTYATGWRFKKRPGIEYFLQKVGPPLFEVVVFTSELGYTADPILNNLDQHGYIMHRLYRDGTKYQDGHHVKDLSCLNRDLSKVIMLEWDPKSCQLQKSNALILKRWKGEDDAQLFDLANFLHTLGTSGVEDLRTVMDYYQQFDDPIEAFKENQKKLQEEQEKMSKQVQITEQRKSSKFNFLPAWRR
ncbi:mitochondrial import inner membrane translocase subunit TIM50-C [Patella vulgata]|uniref:mitochondrial import inner membrane translocase subunit TIM50-C n=1 Tax=Patella vulgata TaxID=6465 RepID=UPI00217F7BA4|nr:mitochondrial import inner membrane translocase subunit TIM50-C [Patella vulgata]